MKSSPLLAAVFPVVFVSACAQDVHQWSGTISDSSGVTIVENGVAGLWAPGEEWTLSEDLRIGAIEGPSEVVFGSVGGIAVDSRGWIFVLDEHAQEVRAFSPTGEFQYAVGGRGEGPGEFQLAWAPLVGPGDTLLIPDGRLQRLTLFAPGGSLGGSHRREVEEGVTMAFRSTASGQIAEQVRPVWDPMEEPGQSGSVDDVIVLRSLHGQALDTLLIFPSGELMGPGGVRVFAAEPKWDMGDGRLLFGGGDLYRLSIYSNDSLERVITRPSEPVPVDEETRAAIMREMERRWAEYQVSAEMLDRLRSRWSFADFYPPYQELMFGPRGTIWVQRVQRIAELNEAEMRDWQNVRSPEWEVFDGEGRYLGVVTMPLRLELQLFRGEHAYGILRGEQDEPYVVRYRVVES